MAQLVKNLPAVQETWVQSLGWEDPLEKGKTPHSSVLAWRIPLDGGSWQATVHRVTESQKRVSDGAQQGVVMSVTTVRSHRTVSREMP